MNEFAVAESFQSKGVIKIASWVEDFFIQKPNDANRSSSSQFLAEIEVSKILINWVS